MKFDIYVNGQNVGSVSGSEAAWFAFQQACELAEALGGTAFLLDATNGEVVANWLRGVSQAPSSRFSTLPC